MTRRRRQRMSRVNAALIGMFILGFALCCISIIPGLNDLLIAGFALFIPIGGALALDLGRFITKELS